MKKRLLAVLTALIMVLTATASVGFGAEKASAAEIGISDAKAKTESYMRSKVKNPGFGSEWWIIGLARGGENVPASYFGTYYRNLEKTVKACKGNLDSRKYTEYSRVILAVTAIGKNPANVGGYNLLKKLADFNQVNRQGINGAVWALMALDSKNYTIPKVASVKVQTTRDNLIAEILRREIPSGGFNLDAKSETPDPDMTAMAIQALQKYKSRPEVKAAVFRAVDALSRIQEDDGAFSFMGTKGCESSAQAVAALCTLDIDAAQDEQFIRSGISVLDGLMSFYDKGGGFRHINGTAGSRPPVNAIATEQGFCALTAYQRMKEGKHDLYDMTDIKPAAKPAKAAVISLKSPAAGAFTVKWKKITGAKGYQVRYGLNSKFTGSKAVTVSGSSAVSKTVRSLKKGKIYYVKVRAYKTDRIGGKVYGSYSTVKKVKVK